MTLDNEMPAAGYPLNAGGAWYDALGSRARGRAALFLDRDGTLVEETDYLSRVEDIKLVADAAKVIAAANRRGIAVVVVTNQAGIGRGYYGWADFRAVQNAMVSALAAEGARLDAVYACAHYPTGRGAFGHPDHPAHKPKPGMLLQAAPDLALDLKGLWLVGDKMIDVAAAKRAGHAGALHVATGCGGDERDLASALAGPAFEIRLGQSIADAQALPILSPPNAHIDPRS